MRISPEKAWGALLPGLRATGAALLDLVLPRRCAGCRDDWLGQEEEHWCPRCLEEMPFLESPICPCCGRPFPDAPHSPDHLCGECLDSTFVFDSARSAVLHAGAVRDRIHQLKFGGRLEWTPPLVWLLESVLSGWKEWNADFILPVPLHMQRLKQRGFNQSGLLAGRLGREIGLPVNYDILVRKHRTQPQTRLNRDERLRNVKGAFSVTGREELKGSRILIVDDVFTTGTTLGECARVLKKHGAVEVHALTVTRALPQ